VMSSQEHIWSTLYRSESVYSLQLPHFHFLSWRHVHPASSQHLAESGSYSLSLSVRATNMLSACNHTIRQIIGANR
jgi:hypothetical protein